MATQDFRSTIAWQAAIGLGPRLVLLAEELPAHEQTGLMAQLSGLMVGLPASIAADLTDGTRTRFVYYYRLLAVLDLIDRVYPALDTAAAKQALEEVGERIAPEKITEQVFTQGGDSSGGQGYPPSAQAESVSTPPTQNAPFGQLPPAQQPQPSVVPAPIVSVPVAGPITLTAATAAEDAQGVAPAPTAPQQLPGYVHPNNL